MSPVQAFKCSDRDADHVLWCATCGTLHEGEGPKAAAKIRRLAVAHVVQTGHEVRADSTYQRGWRLRPEVVESLRANGVEP